MVTSDQLFCQEEETPEKWKVTSADTVSFKDYNFYKISLTEAKLTRYLVSRKENFVEADKTRYSQIKKGDLLDINFASKVNPYADVTFATGNLISKIGKAFFSAFESLTQLRGTDITAQ
ncbi:MAG TPA: hypothetical protein VHO43_19660 [Ignavibacteriales bacterium]|nr:hypothetical protein [Ignavibacteriales bacterium]